MSDLTMLLLQLVFAALVGYLFGAIPIGYLVGKAWGVDVLKTESGRTGGTNVWRATRQGLPVVLTVLGDILKAVAAVYFGRYLLHSEVAATVGGVAAVGGHNWSCFLNWRGGAGGIVTGSALAALSPLAGAIVVPAALLVMYFSHYASLGTLTAAVGGLVVLSILAVVTPATQPPIHVIFGLGSTVAVAMALRPNFKRLAQGTERRITLW